MTYEEALNFIRGVSWLGSKPGLTRIRELLARLGNPQDSLKFIHVAGTNGKGSTAAMLASILRAAGYRTGLYTSPYLHAFNERMQIDSAPVSNAALAEVVGELAAAADGMPDPCTEFELVTAAAFLWFKKEKCDIVVLEVGLGGRLDATNVIKSPECAVITNIGLDHTAVLGNSVEEIAFEKAGIIKGGPVVSYAQEPAVSSVLYGAAEMAGSPLRFVDFSRIESLSDSLSGQVFRVGGGTEYSLPLLGANQLKNAATALCAVESLRESGWKLPPEAVRRGLKTVAWPARFELITRNPYFIVDGGHNPQCMASTAENLMKYFPDAWRVLLIGVLADKDWQAMLDIIAPAADAFVAVTPMSPRALPAKTLCAALQKYGKHAIARERISDGVAAALNLAGRDGVVCSVGSLYTAGPVREYFGLY
ncbi:MAG TPA: bifunctional folylpolyglutamate synthase/dihydrofolate synthase [Clostridiales bacterium]|nr:bifunctional folylpolyglutamate synthase/dihydrofolate synthase [Clostridiales bacterium]